MITIVVKGTERAAANLGKFSRSIDRVLEREIKRAGYMVQRSAKQNVTNVVLRRRSGVLGSSITNVFGKVDGKIAATVGTGIVYGKTHEYGATIENGFGRGIRIRVPKRPWLSRAMEENRDKIYKMFGESVSLQMRKDGV